MPVARKYESNAARQKAYRDRKRAEKAARESRVSVGNQDLVARVMRADADASQRDDS